MNSSVSVIRKEKICSSRTASTLFYTKRSRVSRIRAITDMDTGEEKRTGEVPTINSLRKLSQKRLKGKNNNVKTNQMSWKALFKSI